MTICTFSHSLTSRTKQNTSPSFQTILSLFSTSQNYQYSKDCPSSFTIRIILSKIIFMKIIIFLHEHKYFFSWKPQFRSIIPCEVLLYIEVTFLDLSIDMGIFWGSWFLHSHEIPHPNQWGSMKTTKMMFIQGRPQSSRFYLYIGSERSAFQCSPILLARWQNVG